MNQTRAEYIAEQQKELAAEGWGTEEIEFLNFDNEYYNLLEEHIKTGGTITQEVYNSLTPGQQYHFNKHYNQRADKIINSDYEQEIKKAKDQAEKDYTKYLQEQAIKQQEKENREQKEREQIKQQLTEEIEQLQNSLFDYDNLSPIGKRNINKNDHERKQIKIKEKITAIKQQIKGINSITNNL